MTISDILQCFFSFIAIIMSIYSIIKSNDTSNKQEESDKQNTEFTLIGAINNARSNWSSFSQSIVVLDNINEEKKKLLKSIADEILEGYLNSLELACDKFNNGKLNNDSFKRNFYKLLKDVQNDKQLFELVSSSTDNKYKEIKKTLIVINNN
ncbi:MAG: hypothetical protein WCX96_04425 [Bacilli bacterium]